MCESGKPEAWRMLPEISQDALPQRPGRKRRRRWGRGQESNKHYPRPFASFSPFLQSDIGCEGLEGPSSRHDTPSWGQVGFAKPGPDCILASGLNSSRGYLTVPSHRGER
jgi:hypothetical protein